MSEERNMTSSALPSAKQTLRVFMKQRLATIAPETVASQSSRIFDTIQSFQPYIEARNISIYLSMPSGEVQTDAIVKHALETGKNVFVPYLHKPATTWTTSASPRFMDMVRLRNLDDYQTLKRDKWGIPSIDPATVDSRQRILGLGHQENTAPSALDLILMPGVAFDTDPDTGFLRRLGHGKGFYDRFIHQYSSTGKARQRPPVLLYGLALTEQYLGPDINQDVPVTSHDKPLDGLILGDGRVELAASSLSSAH